MSRGEQGFSIIEMLIALVVFAIVAIGVLTVVGAASTGGFLGAFPTSFATVRVARDYTTAAAYLQSFEDFAANKQSANLTPGEWTATPGADFPSGKGLDDHPPFPSTGQLNWTSLVVCIERWPWDGSTKYADPNPNGCSPTLTTGDYVTLVEPTLTWTFKGQVRTLAVDRFIP